MRKNPYLQPHKMIALLSVVSGVILFSCKSGWHDASSSGNLIEAGAQGQAIDANEAKTQVQQFCGSDLKQWTSKMSHVRFQAGYLENFGGSGYAYDLIRKPNEYADRDGLFRSNQGSMYSITNSKGLQMGMEPPSEKFDHIDLITAECTIALKSFENSTSWDKVEWKKEVSLGGQLAGGEVSVQEHCIQGMIKSADFGTIHSIAFCPAALFTDTTTSSGAASRAQVVIY